MPKVWVKAKTSTIRTKTTTNSFHQQQQQTSQNAARSFNVRNLSPSIECGVSCSFRDFPLHHFIFFYWFFVKINQNFCWFDVFFLYIRIRLVTSILFFFKFLLLWLLKHHIGINKLAAKWGRRFEQKELFLFFLRFSLFAFKKYFQQHCFFFLFGYW